MAKTDSRRQFMAALILGFLVVPALALATGFDWSDEAAGDNTSTTTSMDLEANPEAGTADQLFLAQQQDDPGIPFAVALADACGPDGLALVDKEATGEITDLEQGALDALREVCEQHDMSLPAKEAPQPVEQVVIVQEIVEAPPATVSESADYHDDEDDEYEEEEEEEEEEEGEEEEEEEEEEEGDD